MHHGLLGRRFHHLTERIASVKIMIAAVAAAIALVVSSSVAPSAFAQGGYEAEPVLRASGLVNPEILKGPHYTVDERVPVRGLLARFTIRSDYGTFKANGIHMLLIRVREIHAIAQLEDMSKTREFADAAARAVARPVASAANMLINPEETIADAPGGLTRLFDRVELGTEAVVAAASGSGQTTEQKTEGVTQRVGGITADALGYEKERRDLARGLGVDPYTSTPCSPRSSTMPRGWPSRVGSPSRRRFPSSCRTRRRSPPRPSSTAPYTTRPRATSSPAHDPSSRRRGRAMRRSSVSCGTSSTP